MIVEPPSTISPSFEFTTAARTIASGSIPWCVKNRRSSIAIVALRIHSDMSAAVTGSRFFSAGIEPSRVPLAAYTNVLAPMSTDFSESRSQDEP